MKIALVGSGPDLVPFLEYLQKNPSNTVFTFVYNLKDSRIGKSLGESRHIERCYEIDSEKSLYSNMRKIKDLDFVICFGLRWIIKPRTLALVPCWYNVNIIPIPLYLGGAHVSWQILNSHMKSSVILQKIERKVDRGRIVFRKDFTYPKNLELPIEFLNFNQSQLEKNFHNIYSCLLKGPTEELLVDWGKREYWPRQKATVNGWIDWSWDGVEIEKFIRAFDNPYGGARTKLGKSTVEVRFSSKLARNDLHPHSSGLILRVSVEDSLVCIATRGGSLEIKILGKRLTARMVGERLWTPSKKLSTASRKRIRPRSL